MVSLFVLGDPIAVVDCCCYSFMLSMISVDPPRRRVGHLFFSYLDAPARQDVITDVIYET